MPLATFSSWHYLSVKRIFFDSDARILTQSPSPFEIRQDLDSVYENLVAIDIVSWNIPYDVCPCFFEDSTLRPQNNLLDVKVGLLGVYNEFTVELVGTGYGSTASLATAVTAQIQSAYDTLVGGAFTFNYTVDTKGRIVFGTTNADSLEFLFTSGPSAGKTPYSVLGFATDADTTYGITPSVAPRLSEFRYVDLSIKEVSELAPLRRIFLRDPAEYILKNEVNRNFALLTKPIKNAQTMTLRMQLQEGRKPTLHATTGYDVLVDVLLGTTVQHVPAWVQQVLSV